MHRKKISFRAGLFFPTVWFPYLSCNSVFIVFHTFRDCTLEIEPILSFIKVKSLEKHGYLHSVMLDWGSFPPGLTLNNSLNHPSNYPWVSASSTSGKQARLRLLYIYITCLIQKFQTNWPAMLCLNLLSLIFSFKKYNDVRNSL